MSITLYEFSDLSQDVQNKLLESDSLFIGNGVRELTDSIFGKFPETVNFASYLGYVNGFCSPLAKELSYFIIKNQPFMEFPWELPRDKLVELIDEFVNDILCGRSSGNGFCEVAQFARETLIIKTMKGKLFTKDGDVVTVSNTVGINIDIKALR